MALWSRKTRSNVSLAAALVAASLLLTPSARAQEGQETDPVAALSSALAAACHRNETQFSNYLTRENADAFRALPREERAELLQRLSLVDEPGRPLLSSALQNHPLLRCEAPATTVEFRFGHPRVHENLAFVPVTVVGSRSTEFGMVREGGGWKILSLGLLLLDIPQLSKQWAAEDLQAREEAAIQTLHALAAAVRTYHRAFGKLPESLAQLGPAPKGGVSPEAANLIVADLAAGRHAGYRFRYRILPEEPGSEPGFELAATPEEYGKTGRRSFFLDAAGKLHAADKQGAVATPDDPVLPSGKND